jgi:hypothetical protein
MRGLLPARIGTALLYLDAKSAEAAVEDLAAFLEVANAMSVSQIDNAGDASELTDALLASLDLLHSFLMANDLVLDAYGEACSDGWLEHAVSALYGRVPDPDAYEVVRDREPSREPVRGAANPRDLALAA